jgi:hypothetical protein
MNCNRKLPMDEPQSREHLTAAWLLGEREACHCEDAYTLCSLAAIYG